jgi:hypothetical protein
MPTYLPTIESHLQRLLSAAAGLGGDMWPSVLDVRTGGYPEGQHVPQRVYRLIGAPRGSTLYWDQPLIVAAYGLSGLTGTTRYAQAADKYVQAFLASCVAENGMFRWGNHAYYDTHERTVVEFHGGYHELRPITPAWDIFWRLAPEPTAAYLRQMGQRHVYNAATGGFNRHDDGKKSHAFIEAGGIISESLAWLYQKTGDRELLTTALQVARYSFHHANPQTGLMPNEPDMGRWDAKVCTSEVGLWAQCLLRAGQYTANDEFIQMARSATQAYLAHAYDRQTGQYFGQVSISTGQSVVSDTPGYWPRQYANPWNTDQWPQHDYPMALAEASLSLHALTGEQQYHDAVCRMARLALEGRPAQTGSWAYAESYGRCIHFLTRAGLQLHEQPFIAGAARLADEALRVLGANGMVQGYPGAQVYEAVDGVGYLFLALMYLETRTEPELHGFGF